MFPRYLFLIIGSITLVVMTAVAALAQSGELRGHVTLTQADGQKVPVAEAFIDVYRTDLPGKYNTKTNKKGEFVFAGLPYIGTYTVVVSHPTARPTWQANIKVGRNIDYAFEVTPGDGQRPTFEDIKAVAARTGDAAPADAGRESAADKAKREEMLAKNKEIEESNKKAEATNAIINRTFKAGNDARAAKNWDEAIRQYDEGLVADPEQSALMTNKALALKSRGVDRYNAAITSKDDASRATGLAAAQSDFKAAAEAVNKAADLLKKSQPSAGATTDPAEQQRQASNRLATYAARAEVMRLFVTKADQTKTEEGLTAYQEYLAVETDPVRKAKGEHDLAQMLFDANAFDKALVQYQKILESNPDDLAALLRSGQALFNIGASSSDGSSKAKYQEAANYLARYIEKAPDSESVMKEDAKQILEAMQQQENVKPEKTPAPARRRRP